jgi:hypothetical protein
LATDQHCHPLALRTTLDIDEELMAKFVAHLPGRSKTAMVEHAIPIEEHGSALQPSARCDAAFDYGRRWEPPRLSALHGH